MAIQILKNKDKFNILVTENLSDIRILRKVIDTWLEAVGVNDFKIMSTKLCLDESIYNAIMHAYKGEKNTKKRVEVHIQKVKNKILLIVKDQGKKEWLTRHKKPLLINKKGIPKLHGRGMVIIEKLASVVKIKNKKNKGTEIYMEIDLRDDKYFKI